MDYSRPELADRLAAEYVLGTLGGPARRRFETLLPAHPALRLAVASWQQHLQPLAEHAALAAQAAPVQPGAAVWQSVQARLFGDSRAPQPQRWWQQLAVWQSLSGLALAGLVGLGVLLGNPQPLAPPIIVVLAANADAGAGAVPASFVLSLNADGRTGVLRPVETPTLTASQALELWAVPAEGAPRSLGLVSATQGATLRSADLRKGTAAFAVSLEPAGGSPTGAPTGPIVSVGKLQL